MTTATTEVNAESSPATGIGKADNTSGLSDYLKLRDASKGAKAGAAATETVEAGAESAPAEQETESQETDERQERSQRDKSRNRRKFEKLQAQLSAKDQALVDLQARIAALESGKATPKVEEKPPIEWDRTKKPTLKQFLDMGAKNGWSWEEAHEHYADARDEYRDGKTEEALAADDAATSIQERSKAFYERGAAFAKTHTDYQEVLLTVMDSLDDKANKVKDPATGQMVNGGTPITTALIKDAKSAELIYFLGTHEDVLERLASLPHDEGLIELGEIRKTLAQSSSDSQTKTEKVLPRPTQTVGGRGGVPNREAALQRAADPNNKNGFEEYQRLSTNPKTKERLSRFKR